MSNNSIYLNYLERYSLDREIPVTENTPTADNGCLNADD